MNNISLDSAILITGAGGGLGKALLASLRKKGYKNILTPSRQVLDLLDPKAVANYFSEHKPQVVLHLASVVFGLLGNLENQMRSLVENTQINSNLFSAINENPVDYVFFAGTVAAYSYPYVQVPLQEADFFAGLPHGGEFGYAMSKRHAYAYLRILAETKRVKFTYGVFTNLYGENDRFNENSGHVIPSLIMKAHRASQAGQPFYVWGDGTAQRDFLHFEDAAEAVVLCMMSDASSPLINISSGVAATIRELTGLIAQEAGVTDVRFQSDKPVGIQSRVVDNELLTTLGFSQSISLQQGIERLYKWYSENVKEIRV
ncbi:NAD-dependent epimerase/dehydratase family protein [Pseudomonas sp. K2I15]|uniref:NAD-dependent epimerase/dehydratase family protein n=1 Tax=unclassified Pseudomonas TaxID=196821 RepID=UPI000B4D5278|nr:NAD-dependent epimerase/dehydratase family protein [Pseudomonas sp. K2I15]OWP69552.1 GDP-fucose synthetase [Pseudomonas sp. K2I15]